MTLINQKTNQKQNNNQMGNNVNEKNQQKVFLLEASGSGMRIERKNMSKIEAIGFLTIAISDLAKDSLKKSRKTKTKL